MPGPGFEPGLLRPQRSVLTTRRSRRAAEEADECESELFEVVTFCSRYFAQVPVHGRARHYQGKRVNLPYRPWT